MPLSAIDSSAWRMNGLRKKYGLAIVLVFIGFKMLIVDLYHIPVGISLGVVGAILASTLLINAWVNRKRDQKKIAP